LLFVCALFKCYTYLQTCWYELFLSSHFYYGYFRKKCFVCGMSVSIKQGFNVLHFLISPKQYHIPDSIYRFFWVCVLLWHLNDQFLYSLDSLPLRTRGQRSIWLSLFHFRPKAWSSGPKFTYKFRPITSLKESYKTIVSECSAPIYHSCSFVVFSIGNCYVLKIQ